MYKISKLQNKYYKRMKSAKNVIYKNVKDECNHDKKE